MSSIHLQTNSPSQQEPLLYQHETLSICPCLRNPAFWRYLGEGFEAIIFEFVPPRGNIHQCTGPNNQTLTSPTSPIDTTIDTTPSPSILPDDFTPSSPQQTLDITYICIKSLTDLVLRIPKVTPLPLEKFIFTPQNPSTISNYFYFKENIVNQLLPAQLIPHEVPIILSGEFVGILFQSCAEQRPLKRQNEFKIVQEVEKWSQITTFPDGTISLPITHKFTQCLLMQDFTKHRLLHRLSSHVGEKSHHHHHHHHHHPKSGDSEQCQDNGAKYMAEEVVELDDIDTKLDSDMKNNNDNNDVVLNDVSPVSPITPNVDYHFVTNTSSSQLANNTSLSSQQSSSSSQQSMNLSSTQSSTSSHSIPTHKIDSWGNITVAYEIKPKWGYVRRSKCIPMDNINKYLQRLFPQHDIPTTSLSSSSTTSTSSTFSSGAGRVVPNTPSKLLSKAVIKIFQKIFFFTLCRTCALRTHRDATNHNHTTHTTTPPSNSQGNVNDEKRTKKQHFCPLDLYSISRYHHICPHDTIKKMTPLTCNQCRNHNKVILGRLNVALGALFEKKSSNLICSLHITEPSSQETTSPITLTTPIDLTKGNIKHQRLDTLLTTILSSPPLTNFFNHLQVSQFLLDPIGPSYDVYKGCMCQELPVDPETGRKVYKNQKIPSLPLWEKSIRMRLSTQPVSPTATTATIATTATTITSSKQHSSQMGDRFNYLSPPKGLYTVNKGNRYNNNNIDVNKNHCNTVNNDSTNAHITSQSDSILDTSQIDQIDPNTSKYQRMNSFSQNDVIFANQLALSPHSTLQQLSLSPHSSLQQLSLSSHSTLQPLSFSQHPTPQSTIQQQLSPSSTTTSPINGSDIVLNELDNGFEKNNDNNNNEDNHNTISSSSFSSTIFQPRIIPQFSASCSRSIEGISLNSFIGALPLEKQEKQEKQEKVKKEERSEQNQKDKLLENQDNVLVKRPCDACQSRICLTASMTIKDLSVYISTTPVYITKNDVDGPNTTQNQSNQQNQQNQENEQNQQNQENEQNQEQTQFISLLGHHIPILPQSYSNPSQVILPYNHLSISPLGYFLLPIDTTDDNQINNTSTNNNNVNNKDKQSSLPSQKQLLFDLDSPITPSMTNPIHYTKPLYPLEPNHGSLLDNNCTDQQTPPHSGYNYYLCRLQCGDIGQKKYAKYKSWIVQEEKILATCFNQLMDGL